jgi:hypothetical protein
METVAPQGSREKGEGRVEESQPVLAQEGLKQLLLLRMNGPTMNLGMLGATPQAALDKGGGRGMESPPVLALEGKQLALPGMNPATPRVMHLAMRAVTHPLRLVPMMHLMAEAMMAHAKGLGKERMMWGRKLATAVERMQSTAVRRQARVAERLRLQPREVRRPLPLAVVSRPEREQWHPFL